MTQIYSIDTGDEDKYPYSGLLDESPETNYWWPNRFMTEEAFERAEHVMLVLDANERDVPSEKLHDVSKVDPGIFAFSARAWPMLDDLMADGCRVAERVRSSGSGRFKLVCPERVIDLLDHEHSEVVVNGDCISTVRRDHLFETSAPLPMMFCVWWKGNKMTGRSNRVYVTDRFVDRYKELGLTGADFFEVPRTQHPSCDLAVSDRPV